jgi:hypothetical protein
MFNTYLYFLKIGLNNCLNLYQIEDECCVLIAVPIGMSEEEWSQQSCTLHNGFITYLQQKQAAGIINITAPGSTQVFKLILRNY